MKGFTTKEAKTIVFFLSFANNLRLLKKKFNLNNDELKSLIYSNDPKLIETQMEGV